jgi:hypothetical protein
VVLVLVLVVGGVGAVIVHLRQADLEEAATGTQGVARLLDEHLGRVLNGADSILMRAAGISGGSPPPRNCANSRNWSPPCRNAAPWCPPTPRAC